MPNTVPETNRCPQCQKPIPSGALAGLCPACLIAQGAKPDTAVPDARSFEPLPLAEVARLFPQLEILGLLGAGGMGAVYKARQPSLDRLVALKILPAGGAHGPNFAERFNREARALARLSHPNIVSVHEFGQAGDLHYFIMEFVDGANLRTLQQRSRLSAREALQIVPQICDALQYAHDEGVVHRDIKPENVLVDRRGRVKIADFGLAKILGLDPEVLRLTAEGQVMGTPHYMAPEQVERPLTVDHRADIYSLGVVFYELLTGDLPLGKFSPPSRKVQVDVRLDDVVLRALENDPARRYQHASEVGSQIQNIAATTPPPGQSSSSTSNPAYIRWLGFAIVSERNGKRAIEWKETLRLLAVVFGFVTLVYFVFWLFARHSIPGGVSLIGRLLVSVLAVAVAVVLSLRTRRAATPLPHTPTGTVIVSPPPRNPLRSCVVTGAVVLIVIIALLQFAFSRYAHRRAGNHDQFNATTVSHESGVFTSTLPGGGRVEVLAVSESDAAANEWWLPDGTPVPDTLYEIVRPGPPPTAGRTQKNIVLRWEDLPAGASGPLLQYGPDMHGTSGWEVLRNGSRLHGAYALRVDLDPSTSSTSVRLGFGLEPWQTVSGHDLNGNLVGSYHAAAFQHLQPRVHKISDNNGEAEITVLLGAEDPQCQVRVIALDKQGAEHTSYSGAGSQIANSSIWTYTYIGLPLRKVQEFRAQVRPLYWVEFSNISLHPNDRNLVGRSKRPLRPTQFGPTQEVEISQIFDFDRPALRASPSQATGNDVDGGRPSSAWMRRHGFDALPGTNELILAEMGIVDVPNEEWETLQPSDVEEKLGRSLYGPPRLPSSRPPVLPVTHGFRTREGGTGLLQILGFTQTPPAVTVRYKMIEPAHFE